MEKSNTEPGRNWLTTAECAARTGITIRALRVYERYSLISANRSAKGWRRYGPGELARLNTITVLKAAGLSLADIRHVISRSKPSLEAVFRAQMNSWKQKMRIAEQGYAMAEKALGRVSSGAALPIDELCALIRSHEVPNYQTVIRELVANRTTTSERNAWKSWWDRHPAEKHRLKEFLEAQSECLTKLQRHLDGGAAPNSGEVQSLALRRMQLVAEYQVLEVMIDQLSWNRRLTKKMYGLESDLLQQVSAVPQDSSQPVLTPSIRLWDFLGAAIGQSVWHAEISAVLEQLNDVTDRKRSKEAERRQAVLLRLIELFDKYKLGNVQTWAALNSAFGSDEPLAVSPWRNTKIWTEVAQLKGN